MIYKYLKQILPSNMYLKNNLMTLYIILKKEIYIIKYMPVSSNRQDKKLLKF